MQALIAASQRHILSSLEDKSLCLRPNNLLKVTFTAENLLLGPKHELQQAFGQGVCFVPLAAIRDPELVLPTVASTLDVHNSGERRPREHLKAFLHDKQLLLLLDNFEQVLSAAPQLVELLSAWRCSKRTVIRAALPAICTFWAGLPMNREITRRRASGVSRVWLSCQR
jgi:hypothetical protein